jgi:altronate dehydratase large subunit
VAIAKSLVQYAGSLARKAFPISNLTVGLECGGSDAFSGVTANPGIGVASDRLVDLGARVILTETTELIGTAHILARRAVNEETAARLKEIIGSQEKKAQQVLGPMAKLAISPGNQDGGMSCIREKALGCIAKAGTRPIVQVTDYGEVPTQNGVVVMDGPGYDVESITGLAAAGAQMIIFSTGRGTPIGFPIVPVIKLVSTSQVYHKIKDDVDINAGIVLEGGSLEDVGGAVLDLIGRVLNGEKTRAEVNGQNGILCLYTQTTSF